MLTAINSFKITQNNQMYKNYKQNKNSTSFKGLLPIKIKQESQLTTILKKFLEESGLFFQNTARKVFDINELPITDHPIIAATSMDPLAHITPEARKQLAGNKKNSIQRTMELISGSKEKPLEPQGATIIEHAKGGIKHVGESEPPVKPENLVFDGDGNLVYTIPDTNPEITHSAVHNPEHPSLRDEDAPIHPPTEEPNHGPDTEDDIDLYIDPYGGI